MIIPDVIVNTRVCVVCKLNLARTLTYFVQGLGHAGVVIDKFQLGAQSERFLLNKELSIF